MAHFEIQDLNNNRIFINEQKIDQFSEKLLGNVVTPGNTRYEELRQIWNGMIDNYPALIAHCKGTADVIEAVQFAADENLLTSIRGGGHNVAGHSVADGGLMIDLSTMKGIHVNPQMRTARVEGGVTWGELDHETQSFGLATPGGVVSTTGVAGLTLGGGFGWLRRKYGLSCDNLISADIVTADGELITASEDEHADLYWALRGGGGNFGVVTSFEFRLHPVGPNLFAAVVFYPFDAAKKVVSAWRDFMADAPDEISSNAMLHTIVPSPDWPEEMHGLPVCVIGALYAGSIEKGKEILQPLREFATPLADLSQPMPYTELQQMFDPIFPEGEFRYYWKSLDLDSLEDEAIDLMIDYAEETPSKMNLIDLWALGGAVGRVSADSTAFGDRSASYSMVLNTSWGDQDKDNENINWTRGLWQKMHQYSPGSIYLNFPGFGEGGEALVRESYGENYNRLAAIKERYDPQNLFRLNQNIKPIKAEVVTE